MWVTVGSFVAHIWVTFGSYVGRIWVTFGSFVGHMWVLCGSHLGHLWVTFGSHLGHLWVTFGSHLCHLWIIFGPHLASHFVREEICGRGLGDIWHHILYVRKSVVALLVMSFTCILELGVALFQQETVVVRGHLVRLEVIDLLQHFPEAGESGRASDVGHGADDVDPARRRYTHGEIQMDRHCLGER